MTDSAGAVASGSGTGTEWTFPAEPGTVRHARTVVRETLRQWQLGCVTDMAVLLVSELVTNALRHAGGPVGVRLCRRDGRADGSEEAGAGLDSTGVDGTGVDGTGAGGCSEDPGGGAGGGVLRVEISDQLPDLPRIRTAAPEDENGRGLQLVAEASVRWGTLRCRAGKTVWFELPLPG